MITYSNSEDPFAYTNLVKHLLIGIDNFENKGHTDNDVSTYTHGIGGNARSDTGELASFKDGYRAEGGFFYVADYKILVDYSVIDGVVEQIWQGPKHVHSTVAGKIAEGFTRYGSSTQINTRLSRAVQQYLPNPDGKKIQGLDVLMDRYLDNPEKR